MRHILSFETQQTHWFNASAHDDVGQDPDALTGLAIAVTLALPFWIGLVFAVRAIV